MVTTISDAQYEVAALPAAERAVFFQCQGEQLVGILSGAEQPATRGVLILVGGPQYRAGSHRQFTLLARHLAEHGVPSLRFDYRGMGDSGGEVRSFEDVSPDIRCAIDRLFGHNPGLKDVVIWGLCDAASAALLYAHQDARVSGLVLLNPWVYTEQGAARTQLRHYYVRRLFSRALWQKIARGDFRLREASVAFGRLIADALGMRRARDTSASGQPLPARMAAGLRRFQGRVLLILSGNDLIAQEFRSVVAGSSGWQELLASPRVTRHELIEASHTFARRDWRDQVARWTEAWVRGA
jgi:exosortase A-associated hydrolase 1